MPSTTFGALYQKAKDEGSFDTVIPDGDFRLEITRANGTDKDGKPRIGAQFKVIAAEGGEALPEDDEALGVATWDNFHFTEKSAAISFRRLRELGLDDDWLAESETPEQIAEALVGIVIDASVGHRRWGKDNENTSNTFKSIVVVTPPAVGAAPVVEKAPVEDDESY
jgi:hypothetical protein